MRRLRFAGNVLFLCLISMLAVGAKDQAAQIIVWPSNGQPVLRFTFSKFHEILASHQLHQVVTDVTAENLWSKKISSAEFVVYIYDKNKVRIGQGWISISDLGSGQMAKFQVHFEASGSIASMELTPQTLPPELQPAAPAKPISMTVNSVPQGAELKVDGTAVGATPMMIQVTPGKHELTFSKEGFNQGVFPLVVTPTDVSGGSISYNLGISAHDSVELRDGSVVTGDVESITATDVMIRIGGSIQKFDRNQVKQIILVQRLPASQ